MCIDWVSKVHVDKTARCLSVRGQKKPAGIKLQYFCQYGDKKTKKKTHQRTKLSIYILDTIESESTTRFKNLSSDRMMMSDWLVDDRCTTTIYTPILTDNPPILLTMDTYVAAKMKVGHVIFFGRSRVLSYIKLNTRNSKFKLQGTKIWISHICFVRQW